MKTCITGTISTVFPNDINTDDIIPAWTLQESIDHTFFAKHAFENYDKDFITRCKKNKSNIIVAGENFGCGSSREQAVYALQKNNVSVVIAKSYPDIFYRNSLNNGLVLILVKDTSPFLLGNSLEIDLSKKTILNNKEVFPFIMSDDDANTFILGGKMGRVNHHLISQLNAGGGWYDYTKSKLSNARPQTIVEKIISDHVNRNVYGGEKIKELPVDVLFFNEVIGPPAIKSFESSFSKIFHKQKKDIRVFDPQRLFFIPDHTVPSSSIAVSEGIDLMEEFSKTHGVKCYKEGDGIEHIVLMEDGYIVPGEIILGTDSHTDTNGALNTLAFGVGTTDGSYTMATGHLYDFEVPETIRFNLKGKLKKGVYAKDLILAIIGQLGVDGCVKRIAEFGGPGIKNISIEGRMTICNMAVEMGARTGIFEYDDLTDVFIKERAQFPYKTYTPDKNCVYEKIIEIDMTTLEPQVAFPHKPGNVTSVSELKSYVEKSKKSLQIDFGKVTSLKITDAFLGACTNGRYEDFAEGAKILKGRKVSPHVNFVAIPASRKIYNRLMRDGILQIYAEAGVNLESSNCGPCFGKHMGIIGKNAQMISSSNRNYIGRMGSKDGNIFLASPATVVAAAIAGEIVDPRNYL
jgi:3-isopropylmalate/(R)-2-methylmalate dehydratase large subunit